MDIKESRDTQVARIGKIHEVEGFDPNLFAVTYNDAISGDERKRLPVMAQMAWFRMKYPEGKISVQVEPVQGYFVARARVYTSHLLDPECYLAEATASRALDPAKPTISPREWAQTAAIGIALRNAGFGLQFAAAGDETESKATNELELYPVSTYSLPGDMRCEEPVFEPLVSRELTEDEKYDAALRVECPITKYRGKTLGDMITLDPKALDWIARKYTGQPEIADAAKLICEHALLAVQ